MTFTPPVWNLSTINQEARGITGRPDTTMMTDAVMTNYINYYYQFVLPKELKIFWGYTYYQFYTQANVDQYLAPPTFQTFNPVAYCDGFPLEWNIDPDTFYSDWPQQENKVVVGTGNGTLNSFTFQIPAFPVLAGSVYVTDGTQIAQDNGTGGFVDPLNGNATLSGTINYATGAVSSLAFAAPPANNTNIVCTSQTYMANRPQEILFYRTQPYPNSAGTPPTTVVPFPVDTRDSVAMFVLRPVPDQVYLVKMEGIQIPQPLVNNTDVPFRPDLGPLIALGASLHIFKVFNQMDQYDQYLPEYTRFKDICMQDTYEEYLYERSVPKF